MKKIALSILLISIMGLGNYAYAENLNLEETNSPIMVTTKESSNESTDKNNKVNNTSVRNLSYDHSTKVLTGETAPGADVFVISDSGQGVWTANEKGAFSCELTGSKPGDLLKVSAGFNGNFGTPVEFLIPENNNENISVRNLSYDHSTKVLTGETAPGADVFVISDSGQGVWTANEKGAFSCELTNSKPGDLLKVSAGFNGNFGTPVEFLIPENKNDKSNDKLNDKSNDKSNDKQENNLKEVLPKTGESKINIGLIGIGFILILSFVIIKVKSRELNN